MEGVAAGTLIFLEDGKVKESSTEDFAGFVRKHAYPLVGQLTPENYQFYMDRGLDMFWFGLDSGDSASVEQIKKGVTD